MKKLLFVYVLLLGITGSHMAVASSAKVSSWNVQGTNQSSIQNPPGSYQANLVIQNDNLSGNDLLVTINGNQYLLQTWLGASFYPLGEITGPITIQAYCFQNNNHDNAPVSCGSDISSAGYVQYEPNNN